MVVPDSSEVSGSDSEPLPDPESPVVSLLSRLKALTTSDKEAKQLDVAEPLKKIRRICTSLGRNIQRVFRVKVLTAFLKAGVKLETFREILGFWLTLSSSLLLSIMCINVSKNTAK